MTSKNNLFKKKVVSFKPKISLKHYTIGEKIHLYKKKTESQQYLNSIGKKYSVELLSKNNSQYSNYNIKYNGKHNMNKNNKDKNNYMQNNSNIKHNNILNNNSKISNIKKNNTNISNISNLTYINKSISHNYNYKTNKIKNNKSSNPINTYIINTLNISKKDFLHRGVRSAKHQKLIQKSNKEYESEINKLIKEKEERENMIKKQKRLIEKIIEDNQKLDFKIKEIETENGKISKKIKKHQEDQEQLIMLVKIVQKSGVDVEELIDNWNNNVEMGNNIITNDGSNSINNNSESFTDSINELNSKIDPSSFIPINIDEPHINKKVFKGIPKLNLDILKNNQKTKFKNNSK